MKLSRTVQRKVIVDELKKLKCHPTADELYVIVRKKLPRISLGTVYRNLEVLSDNNDIQKLDIGKKQMCFDGNPDPHYHLFCRNCGAVEDIELEGMELIEEELSKKLVGRIRSAGINFTGYCIKCVPGCESGK